MSWRLLHISDLHFCTTPRRANLWKYVKERIRTANAGARTLNAKIAPSVALPDSYCPELAEFLARKVYRLSCEKELHLLLLSGDIATSGLVGDLRLGHRYVHEAAATGYFSAGWQPTLRSGIPISLLPGNHDRYRDVDAEAGGRHFDLVFERYWRQNVQSTILRRAGSESLALVAADLCLRSDNDASRPTRWFRYGQGYAYDDIIEAMVRKTHALRARFAPIGIVWVLHFPPLRECGGFAGHLELREHQKVLDAADKNGIGLILAGHIHDNKRYRVNDIDIICAGSGCSFGEAHGNWVHELEINVTGGSAHIANRLDYRWSDSAGDFVIA